jgi:NADH-quinone oxidoreductase chain I
MKLGLLLKLFQNMFSKPMTVKFPYESIPIPDGYRGEHVFDFDKCISCGLCTKICPNRAIELVEVPKEHKDKYPKTYPKIDLGKCCFCGLCEDVCHKDSLHLTKNVFLSTFDPSTVIKESMPNKG